MAGRDRQLEAIRDEPKYRLAVWGFRLALAALPCFVVFMVLGATGVASTVAEVAGLAFAFLAGTGAMLMAVPGVALMPKTTRYIGGGSGPPDLRRFGSFMRMLWDDAVRLRRGASRS